MLCGFVFVIPGRRLSHEVREEGIEDGKQCGDDEDGDEAGEDVFGGVASRGYSGW
jgi:hypothetical protein